MVTDIRLKREKDFAFVFRNGVKLYSIALTLIYLPAKSIKVGYAVGKKHGGSVIRNKLKRLLRESFRSFLPKIKGNFFFVFIPKISEKYSLDIFKSNMQYILKKGGFLN